MTNKTVTFNTLTHKIVPIEPTEEWIKNLIKRNGEPSSYLPTEVIHALINELLEAAPEYQERSQWISVDERLPEAHTTVLVVTNFGDIYTCRLPVIVAKNLALDLEHGIRERFTHWMPLPPAPEGDKPCNTI